MVSRHKCKERKEYVLAAEDGFEGFKICQIGKRHMLKEYSKRDGYIIYLIDEMLKPRVIREIEEQKTGHKNHFTTVHAVEDGKVLESCWEVYEFDVIDNRQRETAQEETKLVEYLTLFEKHMSNFRIPAIQSDELPKLLRCLQRAKSMIQNQEIQTDCTTVINKLTTFLDTHNGLNSFNFQLLNKDLFGGGEKLIRIFSELFYPQERGKPTIARPEPFEIELQERCKGVYSYMVLDMMNTKHNSLHEEKDPWEFHKNFTFSQAVVDLKKAFDSNNKDKATKETLKIAYNLTKEFGEEVILDGTRCHSHLGLATILFESFDHWDKGSFFEKMRNQDDNDHWSPLTIIMHDIAMLSAKLPFRISGDVTVSVRRLNDFNQWMNGRGDLDDPKEYVQDCADMGLINLRNCKSQVQNAIEELLKESS